MYHCHINFFFLGSHRRLFKQIEAMAPLENFTHEYFESKTPYESMISKADVILTDLHDMDADATIRTLLAGKRHDADRARRQGADPRRDQSVGLHVRHI